MLKGHNPIAIANHFIDLSQQNGLTLMQLLKLSYIAHGFNLALLNKPLADEYAEAWKFGPVFPSIYHEFKYEKPGLIKDKAKRVNTKTNTLEDFIVDFSENEKIIMKFTFDKYGKLDGWKLSAITHAKGTPWHTAWKEGQYIRGYSIKNELIKEYYKNLISSNQNPS